MRAFTSQMALAVNRFYHRTGRLFSGDCCRIDTI
jgi:hypothetical protein